MDAAYAWVQLQRLADNELPKVERAMTAGDQKKALDELKRCRDEIRRIMNFLR